MGNVIQKDRPIGKLRRDKRTLFPSGFVPLIGIVAGIVIIMAIVAGYAVWVKETSQQKTGQEQPSTPTNSILRILNSGIEQQKTPIELPLRLREADLTFETEKQITQSVRQYFLSKKLIRDDTNIRAFVIDYHAPDGTPLNIDYYLVRVYFPTLVQPVTGTQYDYYSAVVESKSKTVVGFYSESSWSVIGSLPHLITTIVPAVQCTFTRIVDETAAEKIIKDKYQILANNDLDIQLNTFKASNRPRACSWGTSAFGGYSVDDSGSVTHVDVSPL